MDNCNFVSVFGGNFGFMMLLVGMFDGVCVGMMLVYVNLEVV